MKNKKTCRFICIVLASLLLIAAVFIGFAQAGTTVGTSISTDGNLTVNGSSTLSSNIDLNFTTSESLALDWGASPNAAAARTGLSAYNPVQVHRLSNTSPFIADYWNVTGTATSGPGLFYTTATRNTNSTADSFDVSQMVLYNNGDSGDRVRMMNLVYDDSSTQPGNFMTTSYMLNLDMDKRTNNFGFPNGIVIEAGGQTGDDAGIDALLTTGINISDADIVNAIDIGDNYLMVGDLETLSIKNITGITLTTITNENSLSSADIDLKIDPKGSGKLLLNLRQADLAVGSCTADELAIDTGGANKEFCFCQATNVWYCTNVANINGPAD